MNQSATLFIVVHENQLEDTFNQGSPDLFSLSIMHKREELWGQEFFEKILHWKKSLPLGI